MLGITLGVLVIICLEREISTEIQHRISTVVDKLRGERDVTLNIVDLYDTEREHNARLRVNWNDWHRFNLS